MKHLVRKKRYEKKTNQEKRKQRKEFDTVNKKVHECSTGFIVVRISPPLVFTMGQHTILKLSHGTGNGYNYYNYLYPYDGSYWLYDGDYSNYYYPYYYPYYYNNNRYGYGGGEILIMDVGDLEEVMEAGDMVEKEVEEGVDEVVAVVEEEVVAVEEEVVAVEEEVVAVDMGEVVEDTVVVVVEVDAVVVAEVVVVDTILFQVA